MNNVKKDPLVEWLISTSEFNRKVWIIESQLCRIVLAIIKKEPYDELYYSLENELFSMNQIYPITLDSYLRLLRPSSSYLKILCDNHDGLIVNFILHVEQTKGYV